MQAFFKIVERNGHFSVAERNKEVTSQRKVHTDCVRQNRTHYEEVDMLLEAKMKCSLSGSNSVFTKETA